MKLTRRMALQGVAAGLGAAGLGTAALPIRGLAQANNPIKIGVLTALTGPQEPYSGRGTVAGVQMAIDHFVKQHPEISVQMTSHDIQYDANIVVSLARELLDNKGYDVIVDVPMSAGALAVGPMVAQRDKAAFFTSAGAPELTGVKCGTNHVHWTHDAYAIAKSAVTANMAGGAKTWFFITADNAFGDGLQNAATAFIKASGGSVVGSVRHPFPGTTEFSSYLLQAKASGADVIGMATVGTDLVNCMKQAREFGIAGGKQKIAGIWIDLFAVQSLGLEAAQGLVTAEAFYWNVSDATRTFTDEFKKRRGVIPHSQQAGAYSAVWQYLTNVAKVGVPTAKKSGKAVIDSMKAAGTVPDPVLGSVSVRQDGRSINPMVKLQVKSPAQSKSPDDVYNVQGSFTGDEVFRPLAEGACPLVKS